MEAIRFSGQRSCLVIFLGLTLLALILWQAVQPVQELMSKRYTERGREQLTSLNFAKAEASFERALVLDGENIEASQLLSLAVVGETDIVKLRDYLIATGRPDVVERIDEAQSPSASPKEALARGITYVLSEEYVYARYPLEEALRLDEYYPEALHYLALTYDKLAAFDASYAEKAGELRKKRDTYSPRWIGQ